MTGYTATAVLSVPALEDGSHHPVAGVLADAGKGQFEVAVSGDDRYAFVTDETTGGLSVFDLATALRRGFSARGVAVGIVPLAAGAVGVAISPDGRRLYVTNYGVYGPHGQLWVIDTAWAESGADGRAVLGHVPAGCQPVRVAVSPDGSTVWVTALQSNALLGFSAAALPDDRRQLLHETLHERLADPGVPPLGRDDDVFDVGAQEAIGHRPGEAYKLVGVPCAHGGERQQSRRTAPGRLPSRQG